MKEWMFEFRQQPVVNQVILVCSVIGAIGYFIRSVKS